MYVYDNIVILILIADHIMKKGVFRVTLNNSSHVCSSFVLSVNSQNMDPAFSIQRKS